MVCRRRRLTGEKVKVKGGLKRKDRTGCSFALFNQERKEEEREREREKEGKLS